MALVDPKALQRAIWDQDAIAKIDYTGTAATNGSDLPAGTYYIVATTNCCFKQIANGGGAATTSSNLLMAGSPYLITVSGATNARVSVIRLTTSGSLYVMQPSGES